MDSNEIQTCILMAEATLRDKGIVNPSIFAYLYGDLCSLGVNHDNTSNGGSSYETLFRISPRNGEGCYRPIGEQMADLAIAVNDYPTKGERMLSEFQAQLARTIEKAKEANLHMDGPLIDVDSLLDMAKRLSGNVIEHKSAPKPVLDDDCPL